MRKHSESRLAALQIQVTSVTYPLRSYSHVAPPRTIPYKTQRQADAYTYATASLFGGIIFYKGIDYMVHLLEGGVGHHNVDIDLYDLDGSSSERHPGRGAAATTGTNNSSGLVKGEEGKFDIAPGGAAREYSGGDKPLPHTGISGQHRAQTSRDFPPDHDVVVELSQGPIMRPSADLHTLQISMAGKVHNPRQHPATPVSALTAEYKVNSGEDLNVLEEGAGAKGATMRVGETVGAGDDQRLVRMGLMTAVAIGIHNFPEGLGTFVATLSDPSVGLPLAVAIAIHNIPEGLCVAIPVYYATGNRWKAFGWALLSGVSEPIGAALGWLILKDVMSELVYGLLFGLVAGMMVNITLQELIPTAVRYDPTDKVTTNSIIAGMAIMAISLVLFKY